ncbi:MAG: MT-A70 family methyltransferase [Nitratireductor sp.]
MSWDSPWVRVAGFCFTRRPARKPVAGRQSLSAKIRPPREFRRRSRTAVNPWRSGWYRWTGTGGDGRGWAGTGPAPVRLQLNLIPTQKREHSRKLDELYEVIEACGRGPFIELFARDTRKGWVGWGNQSDDYKITWDTYAHHSRVQPTAAE